MKSWELELLRVTAGQDRLELDDGTVFQLRNWSPEPVRHPGYDVSTTPTCGCIGWSGRSWSLPHDEMFSRTKQLAFGRAYEDLLAHYRAKHADRRVPASPCVLPPMPDDPGVPKGYSRLVPLRWLQVIYDWYLAPAVALALICATVVGVWWWALT